MSKLKTTSLHIGTYADIPVKIHWTFGFTIMLVGYLGIKNNLTMGETFVLGAFVMVLFICVVLHEYGHALAARRYGIKTEDIILSPIGGIARLHHLPDKPWQEIVIAIAGPAVNVVLAVVLSIVLFFVLDEPFVPTALQDELMRPVDFMRSVIGVNVVLFAFNLVPAFPMDGGRILRALLSIPCGRARGTKYASWVGKVLAIGFIGYAIYDNQVTLGLVGVFIYTMAGMENKQVQLRYQLQDAVAQQVMRTQWHKVYMTDIMASLVDIYNQGHERSFVVYDATETIVGCLPEIVIAEAIKRADLQSAVSSYMLQSIGYAESSTSLTDVYNAFTKKQYAMIVVRDRSTDVESGLIDPQTFYRFLQQRK